MKKEINGMIIMSVVIIAIAFILDAIGFGYVTWLHDGWIYRIRLIVCVDGILVVSIFVTTMIDAIKAIRNKIKKR